MANIDLIPQAVAASPTSPNTWTGTGVPGFGLGGTWSLGSGHSTSGEAIMFLQSFTAGVPLDAKVSGVAVSFDVSTSGTFTGSDILKINIGALSNTNVIVEGGTEKSIVLTGLSGSTVVTGSVSDNWSRSFWSRFDFNSSSFAVSFRREGTSQITLSNIKVIAYYTLEDHLVGSRAPVPKTVLATQADVIFPVKNNGVDDSAVVRSADVNLLGDGLYNLQRIFVDQNETSTNLKAVGGLSGENLILTTLFVSGTVSDFSSDLIYDEVKNGAESKITSTGIKTLNRNLIKIPDGKEIDFDFLSGYGWVATKNLIETKKPLVCSLNNYNLNTKNGTSKHRLSFRLGSNDSLSLADEIEANGYSGLFIPNDGAASAIQGYSELMTIPENVNNSTKISGLLGTYISAYVGDSVAAPFRVALLTKTDVDGEVTYKKGIKAIVLDNDTVSKGIRETNTTIGYEYARFNILKGIGSSTSDFFRGGLFLYGSLPTASTLNAYAVLFTRGSNTETATTTAAWLVKLSGWNISSNYAYANYSNAASWSTFPSVTNITALTSATLLTSYPDDDWTSDRPTYEFSVTTSGAVSTLNLKEFNTDTGEWETLLTYADSSSPITVPAKSGLINIGATLPIPTTQVNTATNLIFEDLVFGLKQGQTRPEVVFEARFICMGRMK
jgi:hypothetical protein